MKEKHYCFNAGSIDDTWGRVHVPLAKKCTLNCTYCKFSCDGNITPNEWRPGSSLNIVEGKDAIRKYLESALNKCNNVQIIGVSGPGDPLENMSEMHNLVSVMHEYYPDYYLCICTNGSIYNSDIQWLLEQPILRYVTLTINTLDKEKYPKIYRRYINSAVSRDMWENQLKIIQACVKNGIKIKINTVYLQGINDTDIPEIYDRLRKEGVNCFNLIPHIDAENGQCSSVVAFKKMQNALIDQGFILMTRCKHCRADYCECGSKTK